MPLVVFGAVLSWWGWKSGGYFEVVFLPGTMVLLALVALLLLFAPGLVDFRGPALVSLAALGALVAWTLISGIWSVVPAVAFSDAERAAGYVAAFVIGAWTCVLLGRRALLSLGPLAIAGALVAFVTLLALWTGNNSHDFFETDSTLRYPIGYRNAEAAFFLMALLPAIVLCTSRELSWQVRGILTGSSTLMIELAILAQSRASVFALAIAVAVLVIAHPDRLRVLGWLVLAAIPAAVALPWLLDVFQLDAGNSAAEIHPLHVACVAMAITTALSLGVGCLGARLGARYSLPDRARMGVGRGLLAALGVVLLVAVVALFRSDGGPGGFVNRHVDQLTAGTPNLASQGSRFGLNVSSDRGEFWRVALHDFDRHPLDGEGAGGFRASYLLHGKAGVQPEDPHSIEMLMLSELGVPGALLMLTFLGGGRGSGAQGPEAESRGGHAGRGCVCHRGLLVRTRLGGLVLVVRGNHAARPIRDRGGRRAGTAARGGGRADPRSARVSPWPRSQSPCLMLAALLQRARHRSGHSDLAIGPVRCVHRPGQRRGSESLDQSPPGSEGCNRQCKRRPGGGAQRRRRGNRPNARGLAPLLPKSTGTGQVRPRRRRSIARPCPPAQPERPRNRGPRQATGDQALVHRRQCGSGLREIADSLYARRLVLCNANRGVNPGPGGNQGLLREADREALKPDAPRADKDENDAKVHQATRGPCPSRGHRRRCDRSGDGLGAGCTVQSVGLAVRAQVSGSGHVPPRAQRPRTAATNNTRD